MSTAAVTIVAPTVVPAVFGLCLRENPSLRVDMAPRGFLCMLKFGKC